jgi:hypothetical protein
MQQPEKTPSQAGRPGRGENGFRHFERALNTKEAAPHQDKATPATPAGVYLCRRFCINPVIADLVASLAGLGPDRRAA